MNKTNNSRYHTHWANRMTIITAIVLGVFTFALADSHTDNGSHDPYQSAITHAGFAVKATTLKTVQMHLHHVLNCLEGASGKDFDSAAGNPCNGQGALDHLKKNTADWTRANNSITLARVGVRLNEEKPAHDVAEAVLAILSETSK